MTSRKILHQDFVERIQHQNPTRRIAHFELLKSQAPLLRVAPILLERFAPRNVNSNALFFFEEPIQNSDSPWPTFSQADAFEEELHGLVNIVCRIPRRYRPRPEHY